MHVKKDYKDHTLWLYNYDTSEIKQAVLRKFKHLNEILTLFSRYLKTVRFPRTVSILAPSGILNLLEKEEDSDREREISMNLTLDSYPQIYPQVSGSCEERQLNIDNIQSDSFSAALKAPHNAKFSQMIQEHLILDDVLELFMHSNKLGGKLCGLLSASLSLYPRAARLGIIEQCDTCLIVFLHNTTHPMECVCAHVCPFVWQKVTWILYNQFTPCKHNTAATGLSPNKLQKPTNSVRSSLLLKEICAHLQMVHVNAPLPQLERIRTQDLTEWYSPVCLPLSSCPWWPCLTLYPFWKRSPQDFFRLLVSWRVSELASLCVRRYTSSLGGIIVLH